MKKVAIYVRLSQEDHNKRFCTDESESIQNQKNMLTKYCDEMGWEIYKIYCDEDYSGSDRLRPDFNQLISDAENKKFDIILCKTQSRFTREMELVEKYIHFLFPIWGIRFISLVDNTDSTDDANKKSRQINGLINEWYLEDASKNIRATLSSKRKSGLWVGAFAPYGYIKDPENKNHLLIDEEAAAVVRYIYHLYLKGYGVTTIARKLNSEGVQNPSGYKKAKGLSFKNMHNENCTTLWKHFTISNILNSQVYIGNCVQGMSENISYKSTKKRVKDKSEWDIVENTHEAIIDVETWNKAQEIRKSRAHGVWKGQRTLFAQKVRCIKCGGSMRSFISGHQRYYRCSTQLIAPDECEGTFVSSKLLKSTVLKEIHKLYDKFLDEATIAKQLESNQDNQELDGLSKTAKSMEQQIATIDKRFSKLYFDKIDGVINTAQFNELNNICQKEKEQLTLSLNSTKEKIENIQSKINNAQDYLKFVQKYKDIKELDTATVDQLVSYIEVGGNKQNRIINIHWNF